MRRIAATILIWVVVVGGTGLYLRMHEARTQARAGSAPKSELAGGYRAEFVTTFSVEPDPFALRLDAEAAPPAFVARLNGVEIARREDRISAGEAIVIDPLDAVLAGKNELFVEATPRGGTMLQSHALRVRVMHGYRTVADETLWSEPGAALAAGVTFDILQRQADDGHGH